MNSLQMYKIVITDHFKKQLKKLSKKDETLKETLKDGLLNFNKNIALSFGMNIYKLRLKREGKGRSSGYRLCIFLLEVEGILTPIYIFPKNFRKSISKKELIKHLTKVKNEIKKLL